MPGHDPPVVKLEGGAGAAAAAAAATGGVAEQSGGGDSGGVQQGLHSSEDVRGAAKVKQEMWHLAAGGRGASAAALSSLGLGLDGGDCGREGGVLESPWKQEKAQSLREVR